MKRLELDMDRAAWVVEMALEWKSEKGTEIPTELLSRLTRNLFVEDEIEFAEYDPKRQIAVMLLGSSASVKLKTPGGAEVNLDRKGAQSIREGK